MNNLRILTIKNAKFSGFYFYMNLNLWGDFQICISVPLKSHFFISPESIDFIAEVWMFSSENVEFLLLL